MKFMIFFVVCFSSVLSEINRDWWKHTTIYELLVQTFKDSDGDGIGDLRGVISKLDYLKDLGVETIYFTPLYKTGMKDMGYDITDYCQVEPMYGTMEDFDALMQEIKARDMKVIMDLVINHSSNEHEWFKKSVQRIDPYTDYYVWENPITYEGSDYISPPNGWGSIFENSAWKWDATRKQYYYHMFLTEQPDLNLRNENVKNELKKMMKFWLDKGVAGFRMDAPMNYVEDKYLREDGDRQANQKESFQFMHELREFFDSYTNEHGGLERILAPEAHAPPSLVVDYYGREGYPMTHFAFNYHLEYRNHELTAFQLESIIMASLKSLPPGAYYAWVTQDHDRKRTGTRIGEAYMDIFTIITALLPGIFHLYYGQEIGLLDGIVKQNQHRDLSATGLRDPNRLIMQWDDTTSAGFSTNRIPFSPPCMDYVDRNVKVQQYQQKTHYSLMKSLIDLRKTDVVKYGEFNSYIYTANVWIFWRSYPNQPTIIVVINLGNSSDEVDIKKAPIDIDSPLTVVTMSINSRYNKGDDVNSQVVMDPQSAIVIKNNIVETM